MAKIGNRSISEFRKFYNIPEWVDIECCASPPRNVRDIDDAHWIHVLLLSQGGLTFPPNDLFLHFFGYFNIVPAQCSPNVWKIVNGVHRINQLYGTRLGLAEVCFCYSFSRTSSGVLYLKARSPDRVLVVNLPDSHKDYWQEGFRVRNWQFPPQFEGSRSERFSVPFYGEEYIGRHCTIVSTFADL